MFDLKLFSVMMLYAGVFYVLSMITLKDVWLWLDGWGLYIKRVLKALYWGGWVMSLLVNPKTTIIAYIAVVCIQTFIMMLKDRARERRAFEKLL